MCYALSTWKTKGGIAGLETSKKQNIKKEEKKGGGEGSVFSYSRKADVGQLGMT